MRLALHQPDIPQNTGTILRTAACFGLGVDVIEPCGFVFSESKMRRAGMDYLKHVEIRRHVNWAAFRAEVPGRVVLLSTRAENPYTAFDFRADDVLLLGSESAGVPEAVHAAADARVTIPMGPGMRSLNVAVAAAMVLGEALRQSGGFSFTN